MITYCDECPLTSGVKKKNTYILDIPVSHVCLYGGFLAFDLVWAFSEWPVFTGGFPLKNHSSAV